MNSKKRFLAFVLFFAMLIGMIPCVNLSVYAASPQIASSGDFAVTAVSLRMVDENYDSGIRFQILMDKDMYSEGMTAGAKMIPKKLLGNDTIAAGTNVSIATAEVATWQEYSEDPTKMEGIVYVYNIPKDNYGTEIVIAGYAQTSSGTVYTEEKTVTLAAVAKGAVEKDESKKEKLKDYYTFDVSIDGIESTAEYGATLQTPDAEKVYFNTRMTAVWDFDTMTVKGTTRLISEDASNMTRETRLTVINSSKDTLKAAEGKKTYYISEKSGNDSNNGLSEATAWKTTANIGSTTFQAGDVILFERGGVYRDVSIYVPSGVSLGAYGTGDKPQLLGSDKDYADASLWENYSGNVWKAVVGTPKLTANTFENHLIEDVGNIIFNNGESCTAAGKKYNLTDLTKDNDFYYDAASDTVYLYHSEGNPGSRYNNIEICTNEYIIRMYGVNNTVENLCVKYGAAHGISASASSIDKLQNITIRGCEIGWIGGGLFDKSTNNRFGNGIEIFQSAENCLIEDNWIYQCYDAGYTNQGYTKADGTKCIQSNITVKGNLIEYCVYNIEVWTNKTDGRVNGVMSQKGDGMLNNCQYIGNYLSNAGFGFCTAEARDGTGYVSHFTMFTHNNPSDDNTIISGNVFDTSYRYLVCIAYPNDIHKPINLAGEGPTVTGNTWIQKPFSNSDSAARINAVYKESTNYYFDQYTLTADNMEQYVGYCDPDPVKIVYDGVEVHTCVNNDCNAKDTKCDICGLEFAGKDCFDANWDGNCDSCGNPVKDVNKLLTAEDLLIADDNVASVTDGYLHFTYTANKEYIWLREKYWKSQANATAGDESKLGGGEMNMAESTFDIGSAKYVVIKFRTDISGNIIFNLGTTKWDYKDQAAAETYVNSAGGIYDVFRITTDGKEEWQVYVIDLDVYGAKAAADANGNRTIDTLILQAGKSNATTYLDLEYIAFVDDWAEVKMLEPETTEFRYLYARGGNNNQYGQERIVDGDGVAIVKE